jgi:hypothetical protein
MFFVAIVTRSLALCDWLKERAGLAEPGDENDNYDETPPPL